MAALMLILRLIVHTARRTPVFMCQALLDPVAVEAHLVQKGRAGAPEIVKGKRFKRQSLLLRRNDDRGRNPIEGRPRQ